jgi:hypothetical protein
MFLCQHLVGIAGWLWPFHSSAINNNSQLLLLSSDPPPPYISVDQKLAVLSVVACGDVTTSKQSKPDAEPKSAVSA